MAKRKARKAKRAPKAKVKQETFSLGTDPVAQPAFSEQKMAPPEEQSFELPKPEALRSIQQKKRIPHAVAAVIAGAVLAAFSLFVFSAILTVDAPLAYAVSFAIFVGFSIFLYNRLEQG